MDVKQLFSIIKRANLLKPIQSGGIDTEYDYKYCHSIILLVNYKRYKK